MLGPVEVTRDGEAVARRSQRPLDHDVRDAREREGRSLGAHAAIAEAEEVAVLAATEPA